MNCLGLLSTLQAKGISLSVVDGELRVKAPKGTLNTKLCEQIKSQKTHLVQTLNKLTREQTSTTIPRRSSSNTAGLPLSYSQERLWFLQQLDVDSAAYHVPGAVRISVPIDQDTLKRAFKQVMSRHESLRACFPMRDGKVSYFIHDEIDPIFDMLNLSHLSESQREHEAHKACLAHCRKPFNLENGPLIRICLIKLSNNDYLLLVNMHHLVSDGWSFGLLIQEVSSVLNNSYKSLKQEPLAYSDYAIWQRDWVENSAQSRKQADYWREKLDGVNQAVTFPTDFPRPSVQSTQGDTVEFVISSALANKLKSLSQRTGTTLFMVLMAAFKTLLFRYTGEQDICVGSLIANRQHVDTHNTIGMFVNTLALRDQLCGGMSFEQYLQVVRQTCLEAYQHQDLPFERVLEVVQVDRSMAMSAAFQIMFILQNTPGKSPAPFSRYALKKDHSVFDLSVELTEDNDVLTGCIEFATSLYRKESIQALADNYVFLCEEITDKQNMSLSEYEVLSDWQKKTLLNRFNHSYRRFPHNLSIVDRIKNTATVNAEAVALQFGEAKMSYAQLLEASEKVALVLQLRGVRHEEVVAVSMDRGLDPIIALLGVLMAGAAYLPVDPDYPKERQQFMFNDADVRWVLTQEHLQSSIEEMGSDVDCVLIQECLTSSNSLRFTDTTILPRSLAYVMYTSGSTGRPKGVMIEHKSLVNLADYEAEAFALRPGAKLLQFFSLSFDFSVAEVFATLVGGACLVLVTREQLTAQEIENEIRIRHVTHAFLPPIIFSDMSVDEPPPSLQLLNIGGDVCPPHLAREWAYHVRMFNTYGPTEATVDATIYEINPGDEFSSVPIGRAVANAQLYVLDEHLKLLPLGAHGELFVAGEGLARGYWKQGALTAERFIDNPFCPGTVMYRTGDRVRWRHDGNLEYLGRIDTQIKIRGHRVEIGEIESHIATHSFISECVVLLKTVRGQQKLIAFYKAQSMLTDSEIKQHASTQLPDYMLPSYFIAMDEFPVSPSGKIDRKALSKLNVEINTTENIVKLQDHIECELGEIWSSLLQIPLSSIGRHDNFFDRGGHSLLATQMLASIRQRFDVELPLRTFFSTTDLADFADIIRAYDKLVSPLVLSHETSPREEFTL